MVVDTTGRNAQSQKHCNSCVLAPNASFNKEVIMKHCYLGGRIHTPLMKCYTDRPIERYNEDSCGRPAGFDDERERTIGWEGGYSGDATLLTLLGVNV